MPKRKVSDDNVEFMVLVVSQADFFKVDWKSVGEKAGYSRPDTAMAEDNSKAQANLEFIVDCLSINQDALSINFHAAASKVGMTQARNCQQKFKKLIESTGKYALINGKVVDLEADPDAPPVTPVKRGRAKATGTPRSTGGGRKRKAPVKDEDDDNESEVGETPAKKRVTAKRGAAKKAAAKVKEESDEEDDNQAEADENTAGKDGDGNSDEDANGADDNNAVMNEEEI